MSSPTLALPRWLVPGVALAVLAPMAVAAAAQHDARWHPVFDLAMTELRVRDVGGAHTPLIGLQGRIGASGSHPGPISFYLLAPIYRLLGSSAFALQVSTVAFHGAAALTALVVAARRRDPRVVVVVGAVLLLLIQGYGLSSLIEPWNPYLPTLWFVAFLDHGTVESNVAIRDYRVSVGAGARIVVPALGPLPIALDFAVPINRGPFDDEQIFSFYVGWFGGQ